MLNCYVHQLSDFDIKILSFRVPNFLCSIKQPPSSETFLLYYNLVMSPDNHTLLINRYNTPLSPKCQQWRAKHLPIVSLCLFITAGGCRLELIQPFRITTS